LSSPAPRGWIALRPGVGVGQSGRIAFRPMSSRQQPWGGDERLARLAKLATADPKTWPTRERILYEAAALMAGRGYHGATTREIADAVGIQQPSIFNHFANKAEIVEELFEYDQVMPSERIQAIIREGGSPAAQLFRYVEWQTLWYLEVPFDLRGIREELIAELDFARPRRALQNFRRALNRIVKSGVEVGQFYPDGHDFLYPALNALGFEVVRVMHNAAPRRDHQRLADAAASFVLRATLSDPSTLADVRSEAAALSPSDGRIF
jgi:AcrR family transcriptional regulator